MALQTSKGTISFMSEIESGTSRNGNEWSRMTLVIDIPGFQGAVYKLALSVSGKHVDEVCNFRIGDKVNVSWSIYAREYNERWYNQVDLVKIEYADLPIGDNAPAQAAPAPVPAPQVRGVMARARAQAAPMQTAPGELEPGEYDDMPF